MQFDIPFPYLDIARKLVSSLVVLAAVLAFNRVMRSVLRAWIEDQSHRQTLGMLVRNTVFSLGGAAILLVWLGLGSEFAVVLGLLGAGIAFASQETIGSFAGYLNIVTGSLFRIGDRVRIGNVVGDVLDISILRTTVMEIGEWVKADQYTGRIVSIANRAVFSDPLFNYTQHWPYLWDEIMIPITYDSDWRRAGQIILEHGQEYSEKLLPKAQADLSTVMERYLVHDTPVEPTLYTVMTDNWIEMTLRYVVDPRERRTIMAQLHHDLLAHLQSEAEITVASVTIEVVGFPPLRQE